MSPATHPRYPRDRARLLVLDRSGTTRRHDGFPALSSYLRSGDLLVLNDAATLPASLRARNAAGDALEIRLTGPPEEGEVWAVLFGEGDWHTPTEERPAPPMLGVGDVLRFVGMDGTVAAVSPLSPRLVQLRFDRRGASLWHALYTLGRPIQYAYLKDDLDLWSVQTVFAGIPWAVEMPSAGRGLSWRVLHDLRSRGVDVAHITHAAGLSSTGDARIDDALPLPERYRIPRGTVEGIELTRRRGGRVIAVGTTVARALEGSVRNNHGRLLPGDGVTDLVMDEDFEPRVVDGLLTGMHEPGESHYRLLSAFAPRTLLDAARDEAVERGYLAHEFGDFTLLLRDAA